MFGFANGVKAKAGGGKAPARTMAALARTVGVVLALSAALMVLCATGAAAKDKIVFGCAISLSGMNAIAAENTQVMEYKLWAEQTNAKGGLFVKELNKKLPVEIIFYDDNSDVETCRKMVEKLIVQDKVDFMLPPWGTAFNFAVAPLVSKHKQIIIGSSVSSAKWQDISAKAPYAFIILNQPQQQARDLVDLLKQVGVKSVAVVHVADLFGIEHTQSFMDAVKGSGIKVALKKSYPLGVTDLAPLIKTIKAENVDAMVAYSYPDSTFLFTKQMIALNYNPKALFLGVGAQFPDYRDAFGAEAVRGVMGVGAWNPKVKANGAKEFFDAYVKRWKKEPPRWGEASSYAALQILEQAIAKTGTLDRAKLREVIASDTFDTVVGKVHFVKQANPDYTGSVGQWQGAEYEVVSPQGKRTAEPVYPKPAWPGKK